VRVSTNKSELDIALIHRFLAEESTWARGIPLETVRRSIENSLCFGGFLGPEQIAFARVISDFATFANLVDVVRRIYALCHVRHDNSVRVLERCGLAREGILRSYQVFPNLGVPDPQDVYCYAHIT